MMNMSQFSGAKKGEDYFRHEAKARLAREERQDGSQGRD